ncbi:DUF4870 family protein [Thiocapsa sp. UBA6158]|jgi:uncharacterized membrane protein|uniref:DUF4870 family protein n=1 Tax=Thiocapsa sp. UBA6158 TaxID=1947692 RepID=UPI0025F8E7B7|nr:hypothetical protein [Thiocapsa sp. UBA6158]
MDESTRKIQPVSAEPETTDPLRATTGFVYLLQALSFILGVTSVIGVVVNYLRLAEVRGTWLESHFIWQIRTFWFQVLWGLVGLVTSVFLIGFLIWGVVYFWTLYRVVKGWLNLAEERPMYAD